MPTRADIVAAFTQVRLIPILAVDTEDQALRTSECLLNAGLKVLELTLRTPAALQATAAVCRRFPEVIVGVGTVLSAAQLRATQEAGAQFAFSPGLTPQLATDAQASGFPFFPGVSSASALMLALEHGFDVLKLFPTEAVGGVKLARALGEPFPGVKFCATGGVSPSNVHEYLAQPNIACVGGSWVCRPQAIRAGDWAGIRQAAQKAVALLQDI
ncbi:MAG: bifunctional 4-hydroxy-2-oxoglutarate aldolase/2-dehydro-3-deoxy-phosphogluconate aldolase [Betaproteobacteria bacterium]